MRRTATVLLVVAAVLLAGCTRVAHWVSPGVNSSGGGAASSGPGSPGSAPNWTPCRAVAAGLLPRVPSGISYQCATIRVPQDWTNPGNGRTFNLALLRARSDSQAGRIGSLVVNPGGPGGPGVDLAVYLSAQLPADVLGRFDIVGFDPRGVGRSSPVKCFSDAELDASFGADPDPQSQAAFDDLVALNRKMAGDCQTKYGDTLSLFSTDQAARDMDAVRVAVGDPKLTYLGYSYGTLLGATYAQLFPKNVRAFVLDGAVDPTQKAVDSAEGQAAGFQHAFDEFATWCQQNNCPIGPDAKAAVASALATARTSPATGADGRKATAGWVLTAVFSALYSQNEWPAMAQAIANLGHNNPAGVFELADAYASRDQNGHYGNMFDIFNTVSCDDDNSGETIDQARSLQQQWRTKYPLFGTSLAVGLLSCAVWPAKRDPYPTGKAAGAAPIVVVGTVNDPATPYAQTAKLANMLGVGTVVTWQGEGHTAYPQTNCIRTSIDAYLIDLTVPRTGLTCPAK